MLHFFCTTECTWSKSRPIHRAVLILVFAQLYSCFFRAHSRQVHISSHITAVTMLSIGSAHSDSQSRRHVLLLFTSSSVPHPTVEAILERLHVLLLPMMSSKWSWVHKTGAATCWIHYPVYVLTFVADHNQTFFWSCRRPATCNVDGEPPCHIQSFTCVVTDPNLISVLGLVLNCFRQGPITALHPITFIALMLDARDNFAKLTNLQNNTRQFSSWAPVTVFRPQDDTRMYIYHGFNTYWLYSYSSPNVR